MRDLRDIEFEDLTAPILPSSEVDPTADLFAEQTSHPLQPQRVVHLLVLLDSLRQLTIPLNDATYSIGRHQSNAIILNAKTVSRHHALLLRIPYPDSGNHFFRVVDGNLQGKRSHNGVWINGQRCFSHNLKDQDVIAFSSDVQAIYRQVLIQADQTRPIELLL